MTTVINTPGTTESTDSSAGWAVAVIILLAVIGVGVYLWTVRGSAPADDPINVNVTLPATTQTPPATNN